MEVPYTELRMSSSNVLNSLDPGLRRDDEILKKHVFLNGHRLTIAIEEGSGLLCSASQTQSKVQTVIYAQNTRLRNALSCKHRNQIFVRVIPAVALAD
jgi:hypothetical protein